MSETQRIQLTIQPDAGATPEVGRALWSLEDARRRTNVVLKNIDPASVDWQPDWALHSIGTLLYHIGAIELDWLYSDVLEQPFPAEIEALFPHDVRDDGGKLTVTWAKALMRIASGWRPCAARCLARSGQ
jgi:DinB superfamily